MERENVQLGPKPHKGYPQSKPKIYTYLHDFLLYLIRAPCPAHLKFPDSIILIIFGEELKLRSSSLCSFLQPPVISFVATLFEKHVQAKPYWIGYFDITLKIKN
jgi:hypothetical protein